MAEKRNGEVESTQGLVTAEKGGLVPGKLQRRDFGKLLGCLLYTSPSPRD